MSLTVNDLADLRRLLIAHPEWRSELRPLILGEEIESLPEIVRRLSEAQVRTEQRMVELAEAQIRTEQRMAELADGQARTDQRLEELAEAQRRTEQRMAELAAALTRLEATAEELVKKGEERWGRFLGFATEQRYRNTPGSFFGRWIKRPVVADPNDVRDRLESRLTADEVDDAMLANLIVKGSSLQQPRQEIWLVVEVSAVVDRNDIDRAVRRAGLFRRAGLAAVPVVAGETTTSSGNEMARDEAVAVLQDGQRFLWAEAISKWLASA